MTPCPDPRCLRPCAHPDHPEAHWKYGAWAPDRHDRIEASIR